VDSVLWSAFISAGEDRGARVHGKSSGQSPSVKGSKAKVHLKAFYGVAKWLNGQLGRGWALDRMADGELLEAFP
jgi:hypothetical protein